MITELGARNFKSWEYTGRLSLAPLSVFFGANSAGKTSILQTLLMIKQTIEHPIPDWNEPLNLGGDGTLVNLGDLDAVIHRVPMDFPNLSVFLSWRLPEKLTMQTISEIDQLSFFFSANMEVLEEFRYHAGEHSFHVVYAGEGYQVSTPYGEDSAQSVFRCYGIRGTSHHTEQMFSHLEESLTALFSQVHYLGPLRAYPLLRYAWEGKHTKSVGQHGENMVSALMAARIQRYEIDEQIAKRLRLLGLIESYRLVPVSDTEKDYEFLVTMQKGSPEVRLADVGFGVSQVLPVLILCYYAQEGSILILEQPEAHLHPKAQSELGDVLIDVVKNRNIQIILESHSEHLLHRLTRRIAEEKIAKDEMALYSCQINEGVSEIEPLEMDEYGNISNWPQNFFGDEMGDLAAKAKAEIERRKANKQ